MPVKLWTFSPPAHRGRDRSIKRNICHFHFHWRKKNETKCRKKITILSILFFTVLCKAYLRVIPDTLTIAQISKVLKRAKS